MVIHFVEIGDGSNYMCGHMSLVGKRFRAAPDSHVGIYLVSRVGVVLLVDVDPLLDFNLTSAIIDLEGDVCGLGVHAADLADKRDLGNGGAIDTEVGSLVGFVGIEKLFDCDGSERFVLISLFGVGQ